mmetsp:Transcript_13567/g.32415  ORF Transcript_13567/g.32415 Transcript_13567/m.32415 type:complete len:380 (-) Transcript_13567:49-1188(-)
MQHRLRLGQTLLRGEQLRPLLVEARLHRLLGGALLLEHILQPRDLAVVRGRRLLELGAQREQLGVDRVLLLQLLLPLRPPLLHLLAPLLQLLLVVRDLHRQRLHLLAVRVVQVAQPRLVRQPLSAQLLDDLVRLALRLLRLALQVVHRHRLVLDRLLRLRRGGVGVEELRVRLVPRLDHLVRLRRPLVGALLVLRRLRGEPLLVRRQLRHVRRRPLELLPQVGELLQDLRLLVLRRLGDRDAQLAPVLLRVLAAARQLERVARVVQPRAQLLVLLHRHRPLHAPPLRLHLQHQHLLQKLRRVGVAADERRELLQLLRERAERVGEVHVAEPLGHVVVHRAALGEGEVEVREAVRPRLLVGLVVRRDGEVEVRHLLDDDG